MNAPLASLLMNSDKDSRHSAKQYKFIVCLSFLAFGVIFLGFQMYDISNQMLLIPKALKFLKPSFFFSRNYDVTDIQWRGFRSNLSLLSILMIILVAVGKVISLAFPSISSSHTKLVTSSIFFIIIHGAHCPLICGFIVLFYASLRFFENSAKFKRYLIWFLALIYLKIFDDAKSTAGGLRYFGLKRLLRTLFGFEGFYENWEVLFNLSVLRMISYAMDYYEFKERPSNSHSCDNSCLAKVSNPNDLDKYLNNVLLEYWKKLSNYWSQVIPLQNHSHSLKATELKMICIKGRQNCCHFSDNDYSFLNFCSYLLYFPLFIAGPIITYNDWLFQCKNNQHPINYVKLFRAFLFPLITFEIFNHLFYVRCVKEFANFENFTFWQTISYSYWSLKFLWLKFLIIWRFFRTCAVLDGIDAPENMLRCMSNHPSTLGFWRSWHASFNLWMTKYIYIPLGGSKNILWNIWIVFGFAAAWHNFTFTMFCWGFLIPLTMVPELLLTRMSRYYCLEKYSSYEFLRGLGASVNILFMVFVNMVGYALDEKIVFLLIRNVWKDKLKLLYDICMVFIGLFCASQVMFRQRDFEKSNGIKNKF